MIMDKSVLNTNNLEEWGMGSLAVGIARSNLSAKLPILHSPITKTINTAKYCLFLS